MHGREDFSGRAPAAMANAAHCALTSASDGCSGLLRGLSVAILCSLLAGCASRNAYYDPSKRHHTPTGFRNNHTADKPGYDKPSGADFMRWQWQRLTTGGPEPSSSPIVSVSPRLDFLQKNRSQVSVTWVGHATVLMQVGGLNILTDPHFSDSATPVPFISIGASRHQPPGIALADLPHIDAVLISHNHYDHLDLPSVRTLYRQPGGPPAFFLPLGVDRWFMENVSDGSSEHLRPMDWWQGTVHRGLDISFLPVQHWSSRTLWDHNATLWGAWAVRHPSFSFFFAGDMGYSKDAQDIGREMGGFDFAAIPIGAYEPRWFFQPQHINPQEAVQVHREIRARQSLGIHWGTFDGLTDEPLDQPPRDLAAARVAAGLAEEEFFVLRHGETFLPKMSNRAYGKP